MASADATETSDQRAYIRQTIAGNPAMAPELIRQATDRFTTGDSNADQAVDELLLIADTVHEVSNRTPLFSVSMAASTTLRTIEVELSMLSYKHPSAQQACIHVEALHTSLRQHAFASRESDDSRLKDIEMHMRLAELAHQEP